VTTRFADVPEIEIKPRWRGRVTAVADQNHILQLVRAAEAARHDVMDLEAACRAATGHTAPTSVTSPNKPPLRRRDILRGSLGVARIERAKMLGIAARAVDVCRRQLEPATTTVLPPSTT
jgi:hypothetical protein